MISGNFRLRALRPSAPPLPDPRFAADGQGVEFERARAAQASSSRVAAVAIVYLVFCVWSLVVAFNGQPFLGTICAFVWLEFAALFLRLPRISGGPVEDALLAARVGPVVSDVCRRAGCELPRISLRSDTRRIAAVVLRGKRPLLILSRPFAMSLTDDELRGIVAHELAHVAVGDLTTARVVGLLTSAGAFAILFIGAAVLGQQAVLGQPPILGLLWSASAFAVAFAVSPLSRRRELRADAYAAALTRNPAALASALALGHAATDAARLRLFGRPPLSWALLPVAWRLPTHPPLAQRVARLRAWSPATAADLSVLREAPVPPARSVIIAAWLTVVCAIALVSSTLLPWVTETDPTMPFLSWTETGVSAYGWLVVVGGLAAATLAALTAMRVRRRTRAGVALTVLGLAWGCAGVVAARAHELAGLVGSGDGTFSYAFVSGIFVAGAVAALLVAASAALFVTSLLAQRGSHARQMVSSSF